MMTSTSTANPQLTGVRALIERYRQLYQNPQQSNGVRAPHPGDILYWVGCVGAISALLFVATR